MKATLAHMRAEATVADTESSTEVNLLLTLKVKQAGT